MLEVRLSKSVVCYCIGLCDNTALLRLIISLVHISRARCPNFTSIQCYAAHEAPTALIHKTPESGNDAGEKASITSRLTEHVQLVVSTKNKRKVASGREWQRMVNGKDIFPHWCRNRNHSFIFRFVHKLLGVVAYW